MLSVPYTCMFLVVRLMYLHIPGSNGQDTGSESEKNGDVRTLHDTNRYIKRPHFVPK